MEKIWGKLKEPQQISLPSPTENGGADGVTKSSIRKKVWEFMERNDIANFPRPVYNRIPNFKGAAAAGIKVTELPEFKEAKTVKVNPDKPQEEVRFQVLDHEKSLIVPTPRLAQGLFNRLSSEPGSNKEMLRKLASRQGIDTMSKPVPVASRIKLDLIVVGSVAVDKLGRRLGKGEGFADLEFAMAASHHNAVTNDTVVVTTVHDVQVFDQLPQHLFASHDLPVDIIVTPTQIWKVADRLPKPDHIIWSLLTREKFEQMPILREIQFKEKKAGKAVRLADDVEVENLTVTVNGSNNTDTTPNSGGKKAHKQKRKVQSAQQKNGETVQIPRGSNQVKALISDNPEEESQPDKEVATKAAAPANKSRNRNTVGIFVGRIPRGTRVKELKEVIVARGIRPQNIVWKGVKGFALIYFDKKECPTSEDICEKLADLKIGESVLNIEPDKKQQQQPEHQGPSPELEKPKKSSAKKYKNKKNNKETAETVNGTEKEEEVEEVLPQVVVEEAQKEEGEQETSTKE